MNGASDKAPDILLFRRGRLGDSVVTAPVLWALKDQFPSARITWATESDSVQSAAWPRRVFEGSGLVHRFLPFTAFNAGSPVERMTGLGRALPALLGRRWAYGVALDLPERIGLEYQLISLLPIERRIPSPLHLEHLKKARELGSGASSPHVSELLLKVVSELLGDTSSTKIRVDLGITQAEVETVTGWVRDHTEGNDFPRPWIGLAPYTRMPAKQWPDERFTEVLRGIGRELGRVTVVLVGGPGERESSARLLCGSSHAVLNAVGVLTVRETSELLGRCDLFLGCDSGPAHLAAAAGTKCVVVSSARDQPGLWSPFGEQHVVLRRDVPCQGCMLFECTKMNNLCTVGISAEEVTLALERAITAWFGRFG